MSTSDSIYRIHFDYKYALADIVESRNGADSLELSSDTPELFESFRYDWQKDESLIVPDFVIIISELIGCSARVSNLLQNICPRISSYPISIGHDNYFIYSNIPQYSNCINWKKSKITRYSNGDIMEVTIPVLLPDDYYPLFRISDIPSTYFCTNAFRLMFEHNQLTGLKFEEIKVKSKSWF